MKHPAVSGAALKIIMKEFFKVTDLKSVLEYSSDFPRVETEDIPLDESTGRILAVSVDADVDLPDFTRSTMDGYAVRASATFGASEANPAYLTIKGDVPMGESPAFSIGSDEAARISTGGMLPVGADSVVMIEYTEAIDRTTLEVYRSVAPGQHILEKGEDIPKGAVLVPKGKRLRPQETGFWPPSETRRSRLLSPLIFHLPMPIWLLVSLMQTLIAATQNQVLQSLHA